MKNYLVMTSMMDPYPKKWNQSIEAGNPALAINRAFRALRKKELKGKRVKVIDFRVIALSVNELPNA